jgi:hypothetical protein
MPTLDDAPTLESLASVELDATNAGTTTAISTKDLVLIYDISQSKVKTISISNLMSAITDVSVSETTGTV